MEGRYGADEPLAGVIAASATSRSKTFSSTSRSSSRTSTTQSADEAYEDVLADVGCNVPALDEHDRRVIEETRARHDDVQGQHQRPAGPARLAGRRRRLGRLSRSRTAPPIGTPTTTACPTPGRREHGLNPEFARGRLRRRQRRRRRRRVHESRRVSQQSARPSHEPLALARLRDCLRLLVVRGAGRDVACRRAAKRRSRADDTVYLFTSFRGNGEDGLRFLWSDDGYHWTEVPGTFLKPRVGPSKLMRDPSLLRGPDGTFHLVWTTGWKGDQGFGYARSKDLVHWSPQQFIPVMEHEPTTVNVWAPELFYDEPNEQFIICWASTIPGRFPDHAEPHDNNQRMYYTTTRDFKTFAPAKLFFDPDFSVIDCTIVKDGRRATCSCSRTTPGRCGHLRVAFGDSPLGPWRDVSQPFTEQLHRRARRSLKLGDDWIIYYDAYRSRHLRRREDARLQDVHRRHRTKSRSPRATSTARCSPCRGRTSTTCCKVGPQQVSGVRLPLVERRFRRTKSTSGSPRSTPSPSAARSSPIGNRSATSRRRRGIATPSSASSSTGAPTACPASAASGIRATCTRQGTPEFQHHVETYGPHAKFGYKDFIPQFKAEKFDAAAVGQAVQGSRREVRDPRRRAPRRLSDVRQRPHRMVAPPSKGPQRDVIGELADAFREEGIVVGASSHRAEHWWFFDQGMYFDSDVRDGANAALYGPASNQRTAENQSEPPDQAFLDDWLLRSCEIVDKYQPQVVYFDWWICQPVFQPYLQAVRRVLLQPRRRVGQAGGDQLQGVGRPLVPRRHRRVRHRARPVGRHPPRLLADLHVASRRTPGATSRITSTKKSAASSTT